jgi:hypothetical protein
MKRWKALEGLGKTGRGRVGNRWREKGRCGEEGRARGKCVKRGGQGSKGGKKGRTRVRKKWEKG